MNVRVAVQMVSMPLEKGLPLLSNLRDAGSIDGAFLQIQKLITAGEATLIGWPEVVTKSGQRAVTEDIQEVRYATEYGPQQPAAASTPADDKSKSEAKQPAQPTQPTQPIHDGAPVPTAFETRNAGVTLEVEPVVGPDGWHIDLNLVPQYVRLLEMPVVASGYDANGHEWKIEQPRFFTAKTTTSVCVIPSQRLLLAEFRGPEGSKDILFIILQSELTGIRDANAK